MKLKFVGSALCLLLAVVCLSHEAHGCSCFSSSSGTEYLNSKGVYKGRLVRAQPGERNYVNYYFEIYHGYKGEKQNSLKLVYPDTDCRKPFQVGGDFLIYAEGRESQRYCNRTRLIMYSKEDLEYLDGFESEEPLLTISGFISGVRQEWESKIRVKIRSPEGEREIKTDKNHQFKEIVGKKQIYTVIITLPLRAEVEMEDGNLRFDYSTRSNSETKEMVVEYNVDLTKTFADARTISIGAPL